MCYTTWGWGRMGEVEPERWGSPGLVVVVVVMSLGSYYFTKCSTHLL